MGSWLLRLAVAFQGRGFDGVRGLRARRIRTEGTVAPRGVSAWKVASGRVPEMAFCQCRVAHPCSSVLVAISMPRKCTVDADGCVASPNFPGEYPNSDSCVIEVEPGHRQVHFQLTSPQGLKDAALRSRCAGGRSRWWPSPPKPAGTRCTLVRLQFVFLCCAFARSGRRRFIIIYSGRGDRSLRILCWTTGHHGA